MNTVFGSKRGMTQVFAENGKVSPATVVEIMPLTVIGHRTTEKDGYQALIVGYGTKQEKNINNAQKGQFKDLGNFRYITEIKVDGELAPIGTVLEIDLEEGTKVIASGTSKGKGFQGVVKRHGFKGGRRTHGQKHSEREPGSIGVGGVQRVFKGTRMGGRMGNDTVTVKNLQVLVINKDQNLVYIKGALPGRPGSIITINSVK